jgi:crotonobetaine/carnitine-CoA ligase
MRQHSVSQVHPFTGLDVPWLVDLQAARRGQHPFIIWVPFDGPGRLWSYADFAHETRCIAAGLQFRGVRAGDRVLVHMDNCPESVLTWYACARLGAVAVTTNSRSSGNELAHFAERARVVGAVTQSKFASLVQHHCKGLRWMAVAATNSEAAPGRAPDRDTAFAALYASPSQLKQRAPDASAPAGVQFTSGSTGRPKGVVWTHANALWGARISAMHEGLCSTDIHYCYLPLFHTNAQSYSILASLWAGATVVLQPRFSASRFWDVSVAHRCTWASMIPFAYEALMDQDVPNDHVFRLWGTGYCNMGWEKYGVKTIGWWGMTETISHGIVGSTFADDRAMSMGRPSPAYEIAVVREDGTPAAVGETAGLRIRGTPGVSVFLEYLDDSAATSASFDERGFFKTGDLVTRLDDGCLGFADREKDILKVGGESVSASEVESAILQVGGVAQAAVVGRPDRMLDEIPVAFVIPAGGDRAAAELVRRIQETCASMLADFKVPREVHIVDSFPRLALEKVDRNRLRRLAQERAEPRHGPRDGAS